MVGVVGATRIVGLLALFAGPLLALVGGHVSIATLGLLLLVLGRIGTRGPVGHIDRVVGGAGLALLVLSATQPMYWLLPSAELLGGGLVAALSRVWRGLELAICLLLVPGPLVMLITIGAVFYLGDAAAGPHGPIELVFGLAALYGPVAAVALSVAWWVRLRRSSGSASC